MNAISLMQMVTGKMNENKLSKTSEATEGKASFLHLLDNALTEGEIETAILSDHFDKEEMASLHNLMISLVEKLSVNDTMIDKEPLTIPFIEEFIHELPFEIQLEMEQLIAKNDTLMDIVGHGEGYLENPVELLVIMLNLAQVEERMQVQPESQLIEDRLLKVTSQLQQQLQKLIPTLFSVQQNVSSEQLSSSEPKQQQLQGILQLLIANLQKLSVEEKRELTETVKSLNQNIDRTQFALAAYSRGLLEQLPTQGISLSSNQQLPQLQQFVLHVGEGRSEQQTSEQFLRQFQNILGRSSLAQFPNGLNQLTIKLFPEHLGRLDVKLTQQNGVIVAQLLTTTQAAKKAIDSQLHQLRQAFIAQNIQVEKIEINTQQQQQSLNQSDKQNQEEKSNHQESGERHQQEENGDEEINFREFLDETINLEA